MSNTCWSGKPDYVEKLEAEVERLNAHVEALQDKINAHDCACSYDNPEDVCMTHSPTVERLRAALREIADGDPVTTTWWEIAHAALEKKS